MSTPQNGKIDTLIQKAKSVPGAAGDITTAFRQAMELIALGRPVEAEELLVRAANQSESGARGQEYMEAFNSLAVIYEQSQQFDRAAEAWRKSCSVEDPSDEQLTRNRLTYMNNWAEVLRKAGRLAEAEQVLRDGVRGRETFYGKSHAGYAFGLEPLADILYREGKYDEALQVVDEAIGNFLENRHSRYASAVALRAWIANAAGVPGPAFTDLDELPDDLVDEVLKNVAERVDPDVPQLADRPVVRELVEFLGQRYGDCNSMTVSALTLVNAMENHLGDHEARISALRRMLAVWEDVGNALQAFGVVVNLAEVLGEAGQSAEAEKTFREAVDLADQLGNPTHQAWARDRYGAFLGRSERHAEAEAVLRAALPLARQSGESDTIGEVLISLGIVVQHGGKLEEARELLTEGLSLIPPTHGYFLSARSHLEALDSGNPCGCGDPAKALANAFRDYILARLGPGIQPKFEVEFSDNDYQVKIHADPPLTPEQLEHFQRVVFHARNELHRDLRGGRPVA